MSENEEKPASSKVSIVSCQSYDERETSEAVAQALGLLGGLKEFIRPGDKVLLKPNLLSARTPEEGITTHPSIVKAVIEEVKKCGGEALVGDSPGGLAARNVFEKVASKSGIKQVCQETGARLVNLGESAAEVENKQGKLFKRFALSGTLVEVDAVINLPKLKTHQFMTLTVGIKNLFGLIPGLQKAEFHLKVPDRTDFADMLVDLYLAVKPVITLTDAVVVMEGAGPSAGTLRTLGLILASDDALALDLVASKILGFDPDKVPTNRAALNRGLANGDLSRIEIRGLMVEQVRVKDFIKPEGAVQDRFPSAFVRKTKNLISPKPAVDKAVCTGCKVCGESCPINAITYTQSAGGSTPEFDYEACIRCYCCQELCPESAIKLKTNWLGRLFSRS
jgi:uncharacterized protein (DUF362 family)/NAD-dependent dihydropyrimidine dehydrogenase PreA subunit